MVARRWLGKTCRMSQSLLQTNRQTLEGEGFQAQIGREEERRRAIERPKSTKADNLDNLAY